MRGVHEQKAAVVLVSRDEPGSLEFLPALAASEARTNPLEVA
jgi:hypothetical protein